MLFRSIKGKIYRSELDPNYSTVFVWKNVIINEYETNEIVVKGGFSDGTVIEDKAEWVGLQG